MRKVLVTGGAGFIGSHLVRALLEAGNFVRVLDNFSSGHIDNLPQDGEVDKGRLEIFEADIRKNDQVIEAVDGVEIVFHQAAFVSVPQSMQDPQTCYDVNIQGTLNLLEAARRAGVKRVVIASSCAVYGDRGGTELSQLPIPEIAPLAPLSPYAASKQVTEVYAGLFTRVYGLPIVTLRYFNVYGPRQSPHSDYAAVIPLFIRQFLERKPVTVYGDGNQKRDFVYVGDVVRANLLASVNANGSGEAFNICTRRETSLLDLLDELTGLLPGAPEPRFEAPRTGDIYRSQGDPSYASRVLGFDAQVTLTQGLANTIEWMRNHATGQS